METIQELRKRKARLEMKRDIDFGSSSERSERTKLLQEIRELKHPKTYKTARAFKKFATVGLLGAGRTTRKLIKKQMDIGTKVKIKRRRKKRR